MYDTVCGSHCKTQQTVFIPFLTVCSLQVKLRAPNRVTGRERSGGKRGERPCTEPAPKPMMQARKGVTGKRLGSSGDWTYNGPGSDSAGQHHVTFLTGEAGRGNRQQSDAFDDYYPTKHLFADFV